MKLFLCKVSQVFVCSCVVGMYLQAGAQTPTVNLQFVSFPKITNPESVELLIGKEKTLKVELPTNSISDTYEVPALSTWRLGKSSTNEEGEFEFQAYGTAKSAGTKTQLILVIRKGKNDADGLELNALKNNKEGLGGGKYLLMNASKVDIAGSIGTSKFSLRPNKFSFLAPQPTKTKGERQYCFAKFFFRTENDTQPFFSSTWRFSDNARSLVFFYHDPGSKRIRVHTIRSFTR